MIFLFVINHIATLTFGHASKHSRKSNKKITNGGFDALKVSQKCYFCALKRKYKCK